MPDLQDHIDKVFEEYGNNFRSFEIIFTVIIGSGIVLLATPLGQYYFMYVELHDNARKIVEALDQIFSKLMAPAGNLTSISQRLNTSSSQIANATLEGPSVIVAPVTSINTSLATLVSNLSLLQTTEENPLIQSLINSANSTQNSTAQLIGELSSEIADQNQNISQINKLATNVSSIVMGTKRVIDPKLIDSLDQFRTSGTVINNFIESWKSLETPFGELPIGLNNLIAILPIGMAIGYIICILRLNGAMRARERLHHLYRKYYSWYDIPRPEDIDREISCIAQLWIDPIGESRLKKIIQAAVLVLPIILIFALVVFLINTIWFILEPEIILAANAYSSNVDLLKTLLTANSIQFKEEDIVLGEPPLFFGSSGSFYKGLYLNMYMIVSPFAFVFAFIVITYRKYVKLQ